jgi:hypothetical protein
LNTRFELRRRSRWRDASLAGPSNGHKNGRRLASRWKIACDLIRIRRKATIGWLAFTGGWDSVPWPTSKLRFNRKPRNAKAKKAPGAPMRPRDSWFFSTIERKKKPSIWWRRGESEYSRLLKTRKLLISRPAKNAQYHEIAPNWNVSGTRDFQFSCQLCEVFLEPRKDFKQGE